MNYCDTGTDTGTAPKKLQLRAKQSNDRGREVTLAGHAWRDDI